MNQIQYKIVYESAYGLCLYIDKLVNRFTRPSRYSIGIDIKDSSREILKLVVRLKTRRNKRPILLKLREEIEEIRVLLDLCHDLQAFTDADSYDHAMQLLKVISEENERLLIIHKKNNRLTRPEIRR